MIKVSPDPRSLWNRHFPTEGRTPHQHDAFTIAARIRQADLDGTLAAWFDPPLTGAQRTLASVEGWILGVN